MTRLMCALALATGLAFVTGRTTGAVVQDQLLPAPAIELPSEQGATASLAALKGKVVLVDVWASWCAPCKAAFPAYDALRQEYNAKGFEVFAINVDEKKADADRFLAGRPHSMTVVYDPKGLSPTRFRLKGMPTTYLLDRRGNIRYTHEGFSEKDVATYRRRIESLLHEAP